MDPDLKKLLIAIEEHGHQERMEILRALMPIYKIKESQE